MIQTHTVLIKHSELLEPAWFGWAGCDWAA